MYLLKAISVSRNSKYVCTITFPTGQLYLAQCESGAMLICHNALAGLALTKGTSGPKSLTGEDELTGKF